MGISERKFREREERQKLILDCTKELILERGVDAVTMHDIAKKAELSKATLYLYFQSKEAIFELIFSEAASSFVNYVESHLSPEDSGLAAIRTLWMSYIKVFGESSDIIVLFGIKNHIAPGLPFLLDKPERINNMMHFKLLGLIAGILERGVRDGSLDPSIEPEKVARIALMISGGIIDNVARLPEDMRDTKLISAEMRRAFEILLRGLASERCDRSLLVLAEKIETGD